MYAPLFIMEETNIGFVLNKLIIAPYYIKEPCKELKEDTQECRTY